MNRRIPPEAFSYYLSLGLERSYQLVADKFGVSKVAVTACAQREKWQERIEQIEAAARVSTDKKAIETREEVNGRYLKMWGFVERRALESLRSYPFASAMDAARALDISMKNTRLLRGESTSTVEEIVRRETATFLKIAEDGEAPDQHDGAV